MIYSYGRMPQAGVYTWQERKTVISFAPVYLHQPSAQAHRLAAERLGSQFQPRHAFLCQGFRKKEAVKLSIPLGSAPFAQVARCGAFRDTRPEFVA